MRILVTGAARGLGQYLAETLAADKFVRGSSLPRNCHTYYDLVIHCAFNTRNNPADNQLYDYFKDNLLLTHTLLERTQAIRFVFISSIDVYPDDFEYKTEDEHIDINDVRNIYGQTKLMCEDMVKTHGNHLILRCGGIIGKNKIPRSISLIKEKGITTLTPISSLNFVSQDTILDIILNDGPRNEIVNVASDKSMLMEEIIPFMPDFTFGNYTYSATRVSTEKLKKLYPHLQIPSSKETLMNVLKSM